MLNNKFLLHNESAKKIEYINIKLLRFNLCAELNHLKCVRFLEERKQTQTKYINKFS